MKFQRINNRRGLTAGFGLILESSVYSLIIRPYMDSSSHVFIFTGAQFWHWPSNVESWREVLLLREINVYIQVQVFLWMSRVFSFTGTCLWLKLDYQWNISAGPPDSVYSLSAAVQKNSALSGIFRIFCSSTSTENFYSSLLPRYGRWV
jgi:hypothetical protein